MDLNESLCRQSTIFGKMIIFSQLKHGVIGYGAFLK
jgi:hypothetical protein